MIWSGEEAVRRATARVRFVRLPLIVAAALLAGCGDAPAREGDPSLEARVRISPTPPMAGPATVVVEVLDAGGAAPNGSRVEIRMSGNAERTPDVLEPRGVGRWEGVVTFPAPGALEMAVTVSLPDGRRATFRRPVTVAARPGG